MQFPFEKHFLICTGKRCNDDDRGKDRGEAIHRELKDLNKDLGRKRTVRVCQVTCLDLCDDGPNMVVWPEGTLYQHLDREKAREAYESEMKK
ncbi:MAG: (2Fe-2S) ferredoxin domain-containing protein [Thermoanaerobaculia bacterium]